MADRNLRFGFDINKTKIHGLYSFTNKTTITIWWTIEHHKTVAKVFSTIAVWVIVYNTK